MKDTGESVILRGPSKWPRMKLKTTFSNMIWIENIKDGIEVGSALKKCYKKKSTLNEEAHYSSAGNSSKHDIHKL